MEENIMSRMIQKPFFVFNPKSYLFGEELLALAKVADELAATKDIRMFITVPYGDIDRISKNTNFRYKTRARNGTGASRFFI
jgi:triosephosphate isomerase